MDSTDVTVSFDAQGLRLDSFEDAKIICQELEGRNVEILILQGNTFGVEASETLGYELARQPSLREAHFKDLFTSRGREEVPVAINYILKGIMESGAQLSLLDLSDNAIGPIGAPPIIEFLESQASEKLEKLYLNNCGLGPEGSTSISMTISRLRNLREFVCGRNRLENKGATNMSRALLQLDKLEVLKLNQNGIQVEGIQEIAKVIEFNSETIQEIDLSDNTIKEEGSEALAGPLRKAQNLKVLKLNDALLENQGFSIICDALFKSLSLVNLSEASFEGNELHGQRIIDLISMTFSSCSQDFRLILLENEFRPEELLRLKGMSNKFEIVIDDPESDYEESDDDDEQRSDYSDRATDGPLRGILEEGEIQASSDEGSGGYVHVDTEVREIAQEFISEVSAQPFHEQRVKTIFMELVSIGKGKEIEPNFQAAQILCEELGLIKCESTRKKKPLARDAIIYLGKNLEELPNVFKDFLKVVVKNSDDLSCSKHLFNEF